MIESVLRRRSELALQANRYLARYLLSQPQRGDAPPGTDPVLVGALENQRLLPPAFAEISASIEMGSWGEPLEQVAGSCGLRDADRDILGLLLAIELDPDVRLALARGTGDTGRRGIDRDLLRALLDPLEERAAELFDALDIDAPLRRFALLEEVAAADGRRGLRAVPRLVRLLVELPLRAIDETLRHAVRTVDTEHEADLQPLIAPVLAAMRRMGGDSPHHWLLVGAAGLGEERAAAVWAAEMGEARHVVVCDLRALMADRSPLEALRAALREARLCDGVPFIAGMDALFEERVGTAERLQAMHRLALIEGTVFYTTPRPLPQLMSWLRQRGQPEPLFFRVPTAEERLGLWQHACPEAEGADLAFVAHAFALSPGAIGRAGHAARGRAAAEGLERPSRSHLEAACRDESTHQLHQLAARVTVRVGWEEVVLPEETIGTIDEIIATAKHREKVHGRWGFRRHLPQGAGLPILFSGEPGTGKTLVAGLVARELGVELYRVDLSRIVSKYVGETEKQLGALFDEAQQARVALLFDEADSLFSKRTDVKSSVDRYANLEVNYLLQKMEEFDGITILTTNFKKSIDEAFLRRLRFRVDFATPEIEERAQLWRVLLPAKAELGGPIDFGRLAERFAMSGGHIRNAVVRGAFLAAAKNSPITQAHLEQGAILEYREMGKLIHS